MFRQSRPRHEFDATWYAELINRKQLLPAHACSRWSISSLGTEIPMKGTNGTGITCQISPNPESVSSITPAGEMDVVLDSIVTEKEWFKQIPPL